MRCPGQDTQYWDAEAIYEVNCPKCNAAVEFYKDDTQRKCHSCGHRFVNPKMDFGCASYCQFAEQCVGTLPEGVVISSDNLLKDKVAVEMKRHFHNDFYQIGQAMRLARHAEPVAQSEGAALAPTLCAAYLLEVEEAAAEQLLLKAGAEPSLSRQVLSLLEQLKNFPSKPTPEIRSLHDARHITKLEESLKAGNVSSTELRDFPDRLLTQEGVKKAKTLISGYREDSVGS